MLKSTISSGRVSILHLQPQQMTQWSIHLIASLASCASLHNSSSHGLGLCKFHLFCDIFTISESDHLPASFKLLHSFSLWAATNLLMLTPGMPGCASNQSQFPSSCCSSGLASGSRLACTTFRRQSQLQLHQLVFTRAQNPSRNPQTPHSPPGDHQHALGHSYNLGSFEACIWALETCVFWDMMWFGEVSVLSQSAFDKTKHLKWQDAFLGSIWMASTMASSIYHLPRQWSLEKSSLFLWFLKRTYALSRLFRIWHVLFQLGLRICYSHGKTGMTTFTPWLKAQLSHINSILKVHNWGTAFGHSFHIGGASFYLSQKIDPEIVCLTGHWRSLAHKAYIHAFKQIASHHLSNTLNHQFWAVFWVGCVSQSHCGWIFLSFVGEWLDLCSMC